MGIPGASNAINIAKNMELSPEIIEDAKAIFESQNDDSAKVLSEIQQIRTRLIEKEEEINNLKEEAKNYKTEYENLLEKFRSERKKQIKTYKIKYDTKISEAKSEIKNIIDEVRKAKSEKITRRAYSRINEIETTVRDDFRSQEAELSPENTYKEIDWEKVKVGDKFLVKDINQVVEIAQMPDKKGNLTVKMGVMTMRLKKDRLALIEEKYVSKPKNRPSKRAERFELGRMNLSQTLDLRGYRCEDALCELETYLDKASLYNLSPVYIIHGHGTGVLKQAVRDFVKTSPYVAKFRVGEPAEGGDGVIVIDIA